MVKKKAETTFPEPEAESIPERPDPEASNIEAAERAAVVEEMMRQPELVTSGYGLFVFDPDAKQQLQHHAVYADMESAKREALAAKKPDSATAFLIPIAYFC